MLAQQPIAWERNQAEIGQVVEVLIEQENPATGMALGRSARFAPEVDGLVYVTGSAPLNAIIPVEITAADTYDLFGQVAR
jgi:ribosomal protein S12 methylthiotransferase